MSLLRKKILIQEKLDEVVRFNVDQAEIEETCREASDLLEEHLLVTPDFLMEIRDFLWSQDQEEVSSLLGQVQVLLGGPPSGWDACAWCGMSLWHLEDWFEVNVGPGPERRWLPYCGQCMEEYARQGESSWETPCYRCPRYQEDFPVDDRGVCLGCRAMPPSPAPTDDRWEGG